MRYDLAAHQFEMLRLLGVEEHHRVLDIGCGRLDLGSRLAPFLLPRRYFGMEPRQALIEDGVQFVLGQDLYDLKQPQFGTEADFGFHRFGVKFDYMIAHALFPNLGADLISDCLRGVAANLHTKGLLLASWIPGPVDYGGSGWNPNVYAEYTVTRIEALAREVGLSCQVLEHPHPAGQAWAVLGFDALVPGRAHECLLPEVVDGHSGYVEQVQAVGGYVLVSGWSIDPAARTPADEVLAVDSSGLVRGAIPVNLERSDTAAVHGTAALHSGFRGLVEGDGAGLSFFASIRGERAYRITVT